MVIQSSFYASQLRQELCLRNRMYARGRLHVESYGSQPVIVYAPDNEKHGNFYDAAYAAIAARPEWMKRFNKIHAQGRALPKSTTNPARKWRELDSSMSSDALLMNVFCTPGVLESPPVRNALRVDLGESPVFGWRARVPLKSGLLDRTEVDMRWGSLLVEAKLTESDFQSRKASIVEAYRDIDEVFDRELLPRVALPVGRRKEAVEFPEDYSQEWEESAPPEFEPPNRSVPPPTEPAYGSYQLIRNVLAAYAQGCSFCVVHDERRPDLREAWFRVMAAVKSADTRVRLKVLTWQELAALVPSALQEFLDVKYGIVAPGRIASQIEGHDRE
jgi:hypothetical protein